MVATFWVQFGVTGLSYILDNRIYSPPFYTPLATTYPPSVSPENHIIPPPPKKKEKCDYLRSDYLLYGNVRPRGCLKKEVVIMLKNLTFLFFCFFVLFWLVFLLGGGGGRMFLRGNEGRIRRYQLSIKGGIQRIDSQ